MTGTFHGVGVGPGDPELVTLKAARLIGARPTSSPTTRASASSRTHAGSPRTCSRTPSSRRSSRYPVTTGHTDHPGGYAGAMADFYEASAARLAAHLDAGRDVVLLAEGDPLFYGSFMYMHDRLSERYETEIVPGVPAFAAATAAAASPLARQTDVLTVLPGTLPEPELARRLADTDAAVIMKLGRTFPAVRRALAAAGRLDHALYVERASHGGAALAAGGRRGRRVGAYFSLIVVTGDSLHGRQDAWPEHLPRPSSSR